MGSKIINVTKPHLRNIIRKDGDKEVKGVIVDVVLGKNSISEAIKKCQKNSE
jgi:hypothetical protein